MASPLKRDSGQCSQSPSPAALVNRLWRCHTPRTPPGGNLDALETEFLLNPHRAVTGMYQCMVGVWSLGAGQAVD